MSELDPEDHESSAGSRSAWTPVAHVGPDPAGSGGMAAAISGLLASPLGQRYELRVITTHRTGPAWLRVLVFTRGLLGLTRFLLVSASPKIVHVHATVRGSLHRKAIVVAVSRAGGAIVVLHFHAGAGDLATFHGRLGPLRRRAFRWATRASDRVLTVSRASATELETRFGSPPAAVVSNPLPGPMPAIISEALEGTGVLYLGGFANPVKGASVLLEALPSLNAADPRAQVTFAGPGNPPREADLLGARWAGWLDEDAKARALAAAAVVVIPSTSEGLPIVLLEAMAYGKAIVATRVGAIPDVIDAGVTGVLVAPSAPAELGAAVGALLTDPVRRRRLGAAARQRAADFTPEVVADEIDAIYREVLARRRRPGIRPH